MDILCWCVRLWSARCAVCVCAGLAAQRQQCWWAPQMMHMCHHSLCESLQRIGRGLRCAGSRAATSPPSSCSSRLSGGPSMTLSVDWMTATQFSSLTVVQLMSVITQQMFRSCTASRLVVLQQLVLFQPQHLCTLRAQRVHASICFAC